MTALVPSDTACLASSPGRISRTLRARLANATKGRGWKRKDVRGLDLARGDGRLLVVGSELRGLGGDALEDVVDERVENGHGAVGDTGVGVDLLEDCRRVRKLCLMKQDGAIAVEGRNQRLQTMEDACRRRASDALDMVNSPL